VIKAEGKPQVKSTNKPIILLVDWRLRAEKFWLQEELEKLGLEVIIEGIPNYSLRNHVARWRKALLWGQYLTLGWRGAKLANQYNGVVVAWNFICGIFAAIFTNFYLVKDIPVVALNMIAFQKAWVHNFLRRFIYNYAFSKDGIIITANSAGLRRDYLSSYRIKASKIYVLPDAYDPHYDVFAPDAADDGYVFSGGVAARDWDTLIEVARKCPEVPFKIVARRIYWQPAVDLPPNLEVRFDTSRAEFYSLARKSRVVLLPLKTQVTAGLIVLLRSLLLGRLVIATATYATSAYFPEDCQDLLVPEGGSENMTAVLGKYWNNEVERIEKVRYIQAFVLNKFSPQVYARDVVDLVSKSSSR
jgi:hypothetical protein